MNSFQLLVCMLPVVFMLHDFEEIIFVNAWIGKNREYLKERFPRISSRILPRLEKRSTAGFALAVAEEFLLLSVVTFGSVFFGYYYLWLSFFMGFSIHLVVHIVQWLIIRRYVPAIITSILALPYSIYTFTVIVEQSMFQPSDIILWTAIGIAFVPINLLFAHMLGEKYDTWLK